MLITVQYCSEYIYDISTQHLGFRIYEPISYKSLILRNLSLKPKYPVNKSLRLQYKKASEKF